jgi:hypothetical protein
MAGADVFRPYVEWYVVTLTKVMQAVDDNEKAGDVIREAIDVLNEEEARNALEVLLTHQAQQAIDRRRRGSH